MSEIVTDPASGLLVVTGMAKDTQVIEYQINAPTIEVLLSHVPNVNKYAAAAGKRGRRRDGSVGHRQTSVRGGGINGTSKLQGMA